MDAGALSLNQGEKILSSHDFFQLSRTTKSKKISLCNEAVLFVDDLINDSAVIQQMTNNAAVIVDDLVSNKLILTGTVFSFLFINQLEKNILKS